jgi:hypothetical protein
LIVLLTTIDDPGQARADELAAAYHQRWEEETGNDQLKTHLRGPGKVLRSKLPELVHQEIWAWLLVHHALSALITRAADLDPTESPSPGSCASPAVPPPVRRAFPLRTGTTPCPMSSPRSPQRSTRPGVTGPAHARS